jgi:polyhydroxybutyrate depolymerase
MNLLELFAVSVNMVGAAFAPEREVVTLPIEGVDRQAIVEAPAEAAKTASPLVFGFHGHGGTMRHSARSYQLARHWPEAIVVYPQGLNTATKNDPKGERPGWQNVVSRNGDRDLKFVDALLEHLRGKYKVDSKRIFAMGHSNGGGFTYLLMRERPKVFAGYGPSSANGFVGVGPAKPVFHIAGRKDPLVTFESQMKTLDALYAKNNLGAKEAWSSDCIYYPSKTGTPVATYITDADHTFQSAAVPFMVRFFKSL